MAIGGLAGLTLAAASGIGQGLQQNQEMAARALEQRIRAKQLADLLQQQQAGGAAWNAALNNPDFANSIAGLTALGTPAPPASSPASTSGTAGPALGGAGAGGAASGPPTSLLPPGSIPATGPLNQQQIAAAGPIIEQDESGGQNIPQHVYSGAPGAINPSTGTHTRPSTAQGYEQFTNSTWREQAPKAGVDLKQYPTAMSAPKEVQQKVRDNTLATVGVRPWAPWNKKLAADLGLSGNAATHQAFQGANAAAQATLPSIPTLAQGRMGIPQLVQMIAKANPGIDPVVGWMAVERLNSVLAPDQQRLWDLYKMQHQEDFQRETQQLAQQFEAGQTQRQEGFQAAQQQRQFEHEDKTGGTIEDVVNPDGTTGAVMVGRTGAANPITGLPEGSRLVPPGTAGRSLASKNIEVTDDQGKKLFTGAAHETPTGWVSDNGNAPIPAGNIKILSGSGDQSGRNQQMTQRLMIGANEVSKAVTAMTQLPASTTLGIFGGAQAALGPDIGDNMKKALANAVTPQSAQLLKALSNGVSRGLAILESGGSAQGLVGLSQRLEADLPQENDTGLTIAAKYADVRQIVEAATEVLQTSPSLDDTQKKLLSDINENVKKAVPYTTSDVVKLSSDPSEETLTQFAQRIGLTAQGGGQSGATQIKTQADYDKLPSGASYVGPDGQHYVKGQ